MRLLIITTDFPPVTGGIQTFSYETAKNLSHLGEEILILAPKEKDCEEIDREQGFTITRMILPRNNYLKVLTIFFYLAYHSLKFKPDIIFSTAWFPCGVPVCLLNKLSGIPYVVAAHAIEILAPPQGSLQHRAMLSVLNQAIRIFAVSNYTKEILVERGAIEGLITIIPNGVNIATFEVGDFSYVLRKHGLIGKKVILTVSTLLYPYKGHDRVIKALPLVLQRVPDAVYLIAGDGPLRPGLEKLVSDLGLREHVIFAGFVPGGELPAYYHACDVFIMPSSEDKSKGHVEGFGIVYLEANACGKPVIAGRCGGALDAVVDGETGLLVDPLSIDEIAEAIIRLLSDEEYAKKLGQKGRERVRKEFDWKIIAQRQRDIIYSVLNKTLH